MPEQRAADRLIGAAIEILLNDPDEVLRHGIRSERAIAKARTSQTTFFRNYTKESFVDTVLQTLVSTVDGDSPASAVPDEAQSDARRVIRESATADFAADDTESARRLLALALGRSHPDDVDQLRRTYVRSDDLRLRAYRPVLGAHGATVRRPFTVAQLATVLTALREGLHIRRLVDPEAVPESLYGDAALAIAIAALDTRHRHEHVDEVGAVLELDHPEPCSAAQPLPDEPRRAVIDTAEREFAQHGFYLATMDGIACASGVPLAMLKRLFPTKAHILIAGVRPWFDAVGQGVADYVALGTDPTTVLRRHLLRCARLTVEHRPFMDAMIASVSHDTSGAAEGALEIKQELNFPMLIEPVIADGQRRGIFSSGQPSGEFAATLTNTLFVRCFSRRALSPEENADFVAALSSTDSPAVPTADPRPPRRPHDP